MDIKPANDVPELKKLIRTMRYSRQAAGTVEIQDEVVFEKRMPFEVALPNFGSCRQIDKQTIEFALGGERLLARIGTPDGFELTSERIQELSAPAFIRLGIKLLKPVTIDTVKVKFTPATLK
jgi:hypothetical protein